jgi:hypothetical protein
VTRWLYWAGVVAGVALVAVGSTVAVLSYADNAGPAGVVRSYFAALADGDAAQALAFGDVPSGPHTLLTAEVLQAQQRIAPLRDVRVGAPRRAGNTARVPVRYTLAYPGSPQRIDSTVGLHRAGGDWRLDRVAVPASLELDRAHDRAGIVGTALPEGDTLLFPGAVPITFDSPYLQLDPATAGVGFGTDASVRVSVELSRAGRSAVTRALLAALRSCLSAGGDDSACPLPTDRYVPGSVRGPVDPAQLRDLTMSLDGDAGQLDITGSVPVEATAFQRLSFTNEAVNGKGHLVLDVHARAFAVAPIRISWVGL